MLPIVYTVCDQPYYDEHAAAFRKSAENAGHEVRIDLVTGDMHADIRSRLDLAEERCFYSVLRYLLLPSVLQEHGAVLVMDIDSVFNGPAEFNSGVDMALYFRPWAQPEHLKVLLSAAYFSRGAMPFVEAVAARLARERVTWCCEQLVVWEQYVADRGRYKVQQLNDRFMSYDFDKNVPIWTAKGGRKLNAAYLERRAEFA